MWKIKTVLLFLIEMALLGGFGFYTAASFILILVVLVLSLGLLLAKSDRWEKLPINLSIEYCCYFVLLFSACVYGGLYQWGWAVVSGKLLFLILVGVGLMVVRRWPTKKVKKTIVVIMYLFFILLALFTLFSSPKPIIDTIVVLKEAGLKFMQGENPYAAIYTRVYDDVEPNYYNYLPFSFLIFLPAALLNVDIRLVDVGCYLFAGLLLQRILYKKSRDFYLSGLVAVSLLFMPMSFYMLEHGYLDTVSILFFLMMVWFFQSNKFSKGVLALSLLVSIKHTLGLILIAMMREGWFVKNILKLKNILIFLAPFLLILLFFLWNKDAFLDDLVFGLTPEKITSPIDYSLTVSTFLVQVFGADSRLMIYKVVGLVGLVMAGLIGLVRGSYVYKSYLIFLVLNMFSYHAFMNSYFWVAMLLWIDIAFNYFMVELGSTTEI